MSCRDLLLAHCHRPYIPLAMKMKVDIGSELLCSFAATRLYVGHAGLKSDAPE
jgi:hypothetical protein